MTTEKYYQVIYNTDSMEGRGSTESTGINFENKADALAFVRSYRFASKWGIMGTPGTEYNVQEKTKKLPKIYESLAEYDEEHPDKETLKKIKADALAKLTKVERNALGLD